MLWWGHQHFLITRSNVECHEWHLLPWRALAWLAYWQVSARETANALNGSLWSRLLDEEYNVAKSQIKTVGHLASSTLTHGPDLQYFILNRPALHLHHITLCSSSIPCTLTRYRCYSDMQPVILTCRKPIAASLIQPLMLPYAVIKTLTQEEIVQSWRCIKLITFITLTSTILQSKTGYGPLVPK